MNVKEGDELDFVPQDDNYVIVKRGATAAATRTQSGVRFMQTQQISISDEELAILRKLDTIRYGNRTKAQLRQILNENERKILQGLIKKGYVEPYKKAGEQEYKYGIKKSVYNQFLFGKRSQQPQQPQQQKAQQQPQKQTPQPRKWEMDLGKGTSTIELLETNGYLVISNQAEAAKVSTELEASIRNGQVVGTRAFNKKYYITLKAYVNANASKVMSAIGPKGASVQDISKATGVEEDGVRVILYMLAESGDATEVKRDFFKLVL